MPHEFAVGTKALRAVPEVQLEEARSSIGERMGLKLGKVQVKIKHAPYPKE